MLNAMNDNNGPVKPFLYKTTHRGLAAALMALGFELLGVTTNEEQVLFAFPVTPDLLESVEAYWDDLLSVSANRMGGAIEYLELVAGQERADDDLMAV